MNATTRKAPLPADVIAALNYWLDEHPGDVRPSGLLNDIKAARALCLSFSDASKWTDEDKPLPEDEAIHAAHPVVSGQHKNYEKALRLVGAKRSKAALVDLVNWLLCQAEDDHEAASGMSADVTVMGQRIEELERAMSEGNNAAEERLVRWQNRAFHYAGWTNTLVKLLKEAIQHYSRHGERAPERWLNAAHADHHKIDMETTALAKPDCDAEQACGEIRRDLDAELARVTEYAERIQAVAIKAANDMDDIANDMSLLTVEETIQQLRDGAAEVHAALANQCGSMQTGSRQGSSSAPDGATPSSRSNCVHGV